MVKKVSKDWAEGFKARVFIAYNSQDYEDIGEKSGFGYQNIYNYLNGKREPSIEALIQFVKQTDVSLHWLVIGEGNQYPGSFKSSTSLKIQEEPDMDIVAAFSNLPDTAKEEISKQLIETLAKHSQSLSKKKGKDIPVVEQNNFLMADPQNEDPKKARKSALVRKDIADAKARGRELKARRSE